MHVALLIAATLSAEPTDDQIKLLKTFRDEFVLITPGTEKYPAQITLGRAEGGQPAERPAHQVRLSKPFSIAKYEVPQNLWQAVMGSNPSRWKGPRNSAEMFSFEEAKQFCTKATAMMRTAGLIGAHEAVGLPTEAEWEFVARSGTDSVYSFGDDPERLGDFGWYTGNATGNDPPVGAKKPNAWGLYDVHGYLWEFCEDVWHDSYEGAPADGSAWLQAGDATRRVLRGGSWKDSASQLTSSYRKAIGKNERDDAVGLRCVLR